MVKLRNGKIKFDQRESPVFYQSILFLMHLKDLMQLDLEELDHSILYCCHCHTHIV